MTKVGKPRGFTVIRETQGRHRLEMLVEFSDQLGQRLARRVAGRITGGWLGRLFR